jgi:hypothetical protein
LAITTKSERIKRFGGLLGTDVNFAGNSDCFLSEETKAKSMSLKATVVRNGLVRKDAYQVRANLLERAIDKFSQESNLSRCLSIDISLPSVAKKSFDFKTLFSYRRCENTCRVQHSMF